MTDVQGLFLISPDPALRRLLAEPLAGRGWRVHTAAHWETVTPEAGALLLLDLGTGGDVAGFCQRWQQARGGAILLLAPSPAEAAAALTSGADALLPLPVRLPLLISRLDQLRQRPDRTTMLDLGALRLDLHTRQLEGGSGPTQRLTDKEVSLLRHLLAAPHRQSSRDALLQAVWGYRADLSTHTLETHLYRLRRKLKTQAAGLIEIRTISTGYQLVLADAGTEQTPSDQQDQPA